MFYKIILFSSIIFIHEIGHAFMGIIMGWNLDKICIYPFGGCTKFNTLVNNSFFSELLVLISGPLVQICFYFIYRNFVSDLDLFVTYNKFILFFNMLPIYPLDGGKLLNLFISYFFPYKLSLKLCIYISYIIVFCIFFVFWGNYSLFICLSIFFLIYNICLEYKKINYVYNKFLLERYIYIFNFKKSINIKTISDFYKYKINYIFYNNLLLDEKEYLKIKMSKG